MKRRKRSTYDAKTDENAASLASASLGVLLGTLKTSVVMAFEMPPAPGERDMTIVTTIAVLPTNYAEEYVDRAKDIHQDLIEEFQLKYLHDMHAWGEEVDQQV